MKRGTLIASAVLLALQAGVLVLLASDVLGDYDSPVPVLVVYFLGGTWFFAVGAALSLGGGLLRWFVSRPNDGC